MQRSMEMFACSGLSELGPLLLLSSMSRFRHIEALMLCAEMAWAVREAHHEVVHNVLHGEIVDSQDENILQVRAAATALRLVTAVLNGRFATAVLKQPLADGFSRRRRAATWRRRCGRWYGRRR